ncbi:MAG: UDP-N-acetylmuramate dehydrogenase [Myxococcales bacterium]|nr:UDP-N-acetylmuramate dehydrogenase [Myxococcales bacterium]
MKLQEHVPLAPRTTFALGGAARGFVEVHDEDEVREALAFARSRGWPVLVLGGGSNLVVADAGFAGLVLAMASRGVRVDDGGLVTCAAGEPWDPFVEAMVARGLAGLECLAGIPGLVGATPIQNVGAYGQEVSASIVRVRSLAVDTGEARERTTAECGFGYRSSIWKTAPIREVVTEVTFQLRPGGAASVRYDELARALAKEPDQSLARVREVILGLRRAKSMVYDPRDPNHRSAGSFFMNPIVDVAVADAIAASTAPAVPPRFPAEGGKVKLAAAWLIERAGFPKGTRRGNVGQSSAHALALVQHGGASAAELVAFAEEIVAAVRVRFGVTLEAEPLRVGF